jgi:hypothetical protein
VYVATSVPVIAAISGVDQQPVVIADAKGWNQKRPVTHGEKQSPFPAKRRGKGVCDCLDGLLVAPAAVTASVTATAAAVTTSATAARPAATPIFPWFGFVDGE